MDTKKDPYVCCLQETHFKSRDTYRLKTRGWKKIVVDIQLLNDVWLFGTPWTTAHQAPLSSTMSQSLLKFMSTKSRMLPNNLILCHSPSHFAFNLSQHRGLFQVFSLRIRWPKYWSFSISPSNKYSGLISFRIDWFDLLTVQRDFQESSPALQFESINSSVLSLPYGPTRTSIHDYWKIHSFD